MSVASQKGQGGPPPGDTIQGVTFNNKKVSFPILTTVLHYRADCDKLCVYLLIVLIASC